MGTLSSLRQIEKVENVPYAKKAYIK